MRVILGLLLCAALSATEERPWIEPTLQPLWNTSADYQHFNQLKSGARHIDYSGNTLLFGGGFFLAPSPDYSLEAELGLAKTHKNSMGLDAFKQTGRYLFLDDTQGDVLSLVAGLAFTEPMRKALYDPSLMHHGYFETEGHLSAGKEWVLEDQWTNRVFALFGAGFANQGSAWLKGRLGAEINVWDEHFFQAVLETGAGLGGKNLHTHHFKGYGNVAYRFLDFSLGYEYKCSDYARFRLDLLQRLISYNTPYAIQEVRFEMIYPFNL